jgi:hypothetical protein
MSSPALPGSSLPLGLPGHGPIYSPRPSSFVPPLDLSCHGVEREPNDLAIRPQDGEVID